MSDLEQVIIDACLVEHSVDLERNSHDSQEVLDTSLCLSEAINEGPEEQNKKSAN